MPGAVETGREKASLSGASSRCGSSLGTPWKRSSTMCIWNWKERRRGHGAPRHGLVWVNMPGEGRRGGNGGGGRPAKPYRVGGWRRALM